MAFDAQAEGGGGGVKIVIVVVMAGGICRVWIGCIGNGLDVA